MIHDTKNADSRTADENLTLESLKEATEIHIDEVSECMDFFAAKLIEAGNNHDWTKLDNFDEEYGPLVLSGISNEEFQASDWHNRHIFTERHHIGHDAKVDVNLVDVIEHICDVVAAGKGRAGHISSMYCDIDPKLLYRAYWNTIRLLDENTKIISHPSEDPKFIKECIEQDPIKLEMELHTVGARCIYDILDEMEHLFDDYKNDEYYDARIAYGFMQAVKYIKKELEGRD